MTFEFPLGLVRVRVIMGILMLNIGACMSELNSGRQCLLLGRVMSVMYVGSSLGCAALTRTRDDGLLICGKLTWQQVLGCLWLLSLVRVIVAPNAILYRAGVLVRHVLLCVRPCRNVCREAVCVPLLTARQARA